MVEKITPESNYGELLRSCSRFNCNLSIDRRSKVPFLDAQTGIAQKPGNLWRSSSERRLGATPDIAYVYPAIRWKKKKRDISAAVPDFRYIGVNPNHPVAEPPKPVFNAFAMPEQPPRPMDPVYLASESTVQQRVYATPKESYNEFDELSDELDDYEDPSDGDDYAETPKSKSRKSIPKKKTASGAPYTLGKDGKKRYFGGAAAALIPPEEKPYSCPYCGAKYKSKPGLNYHLAHVHSDFNALQKQNSNSSTTDTPTATTTAPATPTSSSTSQQNTPSGPVKSGSESNLQVSNYCDFCLGNGTENKKTGEREELTSCHDCGRAGHPTCLKFTPNMIISTKKYGWQCIECKSCAICGTSENDDQLLFCDDCDRGFHLYCLNPPLAAPPEGLWSCHLCQVEFKALASRPSPEFASAAPAAPPTATPKGMSPK